MLNIDSDWWRALVVIALATGTLACGEIDEEERNQQEQQEQQEQEEEIEGIEVAGTWMTQFDSIEEIDEEIWSFMFIIDYDNEARRAITQNPSDDDFNPDAFNLLVWTPLVDDEFHYCTVAFGLETEAQAREVSSDDADAGDLDGGCGGFSWTHMVRQ